MRTAKQPGCREARTWGSKPRHGGHTDDVRKRFPSLAAQHRVVSSVIGRFIHLSILVDRKTISATWLKNLKKKNGKPLCAKISQTLRAGAGMAFSDCAWPAREVWALFDHIDHIANRTAFPISRSERKRFPSQALQLIWRSIKNGRIAPPPPNADLAQHASAIREPGHEETIPFVHHVARNSPFHVLRFVH